MQHHTLRFPFLAALSLAACGGTASGCTVTTVTSGLPRGEGGASLLQAASDRTSVRHASEGKGWGRRMGRHRARE